MTAVQVIFILITLPITIVGAFLHIIYAAFSVGWNMGEDLCMSLFPPPKAPAIQDGNGRPT